MLGQYRAEDRRHEHQYQDHVEHAIVEQALTGGAQRIVCDERRGERCGDLR